MLYSIYLPLVNMEAFGTLLTVSYGNSTHSFPSSKIFPNASCPSLDAAILKANKLSFTTFCSVCAGSASSCNGSHMASRRRAHSLKPIEALSTSRGSLSSSWNIGGITCGPWMPRMEDLDTTNMLLRQRIVFLGSQFVAIANQWSRVQSPWSHFESTHNSSPKDTVVTSLIVMESFESHPNNVIGLKDQSVFIPIPIGVISFLRLLFGPRPLDGSSRQLKRAPVDDMSADFIISQLLFLDAEDSTKDIKLFINSPGGSVTAGIFNKNSGQITDSEYSWQHNHLVQRGYV
eukprot:Gb_14699 [translate_table: standard]